MPAASASSRRATTPPGAAALLEGVDLTEFEVQGASGHLLLVVGYTR